MGYRRIDERYASRSIFEDRHYFDFVLDQSRSLLDLRPSLRILEVGVGSGAFLRQLGSRYPGHHLSGLDCVPAIVQAMALKLPEVVMHHGDISDASSLPNERYDALFMNLVHPYFDECESWMRNCAELTAPEGSCIVFGPFNPQPVDVVTRVRYADVPEDWLTGWNIFSKATIERTAHRVGFETRFDDYAPAADLHQPSSDPLLTQTLRLEGGERIIVNGAQIVHPMSVLRLQRAS